jgi:hypothetical protein
MRSGRCYARPTWVPRTSGNGSSSWPTARAEDSEQCGNHPGSTDSLTGAIRQWPTPAAREYKGANGEEHLENGTGRKHLDQLPNFVAHLWATPNVPNGGRSSSTSNYTEDGKKRQIDIVAQASNWPTPTAEPYGSSQNGINGKGGAHERPSAATPSLERMSHSFLPGLPTSTPGAGSSASDQTSRPLWPTPNTDDGGSTETHRGTGSRKKLLGHATDALWKTPHGIANMDASGKVAGGGGEFAKQVMQHPETWKPNGDGMWGTPTADTGGDGPRPSGVRTLLCNQVKTPTASKAKLNPNFVEWLMGLPIGWTSVTAWTDSERAAMASYRFRLRQRLSSWLAEQN